MDTNEKILRLESLLKTQADDPLTHFLLGREYMEAERFADGARALEKCVELNPHHTAAYRFLGDCHRKSGDLDRAREVYSAGISIAEHTGDMQAGKEMETFLKKLNKQ